MMNSNEMTYHAIMTLAREMLKKGIINAEEYAVIDTKTAEKYAISLVSLCG